MEEVRQDERFAGIRKDPRYRQMPKAERKVKIDSRFKSMFTDKQFKTKYTVDKRGRPVNATTNENLRRFYELSDDDSGSESDSDVGEQEQTESVSLNKKVQKKKKSDKKSKKDKSKKSAIITDDVDKKNKKKDKKTRSCEDKTRSCEDKTRSCEDKTRSSADRSKRKITDAEEEIKFTSDEEEEELEDDDDQASDVSEDAEVGISGTAGDRARGVGNLDSSSSEEEDSEEEEEDADGQFDHKWGELDKDVPEATEIGCRLAVCNLDWDRIKAQDIYVLLNSFKPKDGVLHSVTVYPSEYGLERMKEEELKGPLELVASKQEEGASQDAEKKEGDQYHIEKLRQYQLNRLKYYYAVAVCDDPATGSTIYDGCDGLEYETSSTKMDLRFIPDDMTFDTEPKSVCTEMPDSATYKPSIFFTTALSQSKVDLTWDETDPDRIQVTMRNFKKEDIEEDDFKAYLASDSEDEGTDATLAAIDGSDSDGEEEESEEKQIDKYRKLVQSLAQTEETNQRDVDMEITWEPGLRDTAKELVKKKKEGQDQTVWEKYLQKKKEKKKEKREERKRKRLGDDPLQSAKTKTSSKLDKVSHVKEVEEEAAFSDDDLPAGVDLGDSYFTEELGEQQPATVKKKKKKKEKLTKEELEEQTQKEAELSLLLMETQEDNKQHFNLKSLVDDAKTNKKKKRKEKGKEGKQNKEDDFEVNVRDPRFEAMYQSHLFNLDPSVPEYKKTNGTEAFVKEKIERRLKCEEPGTGEHRSSKSSLDQSPVDKRKRELGTDTTGPKSKISRSGDDKKDRILIDTEQTLDSLVKSVKAKTQQFQTKRKK